MVIKIEIQKLKLITKKRVIEVEPNPAAPQKLQVKVNGQQYTQEEVERDQRENPDLEGIEYSSNSGNDNTDTVTIDTDEVTVRFNSQNGARIHMDGKNKRTACGLCGNFDEDRRNDHRQPNGQMAQKLSTLHRSYTLQDNQEGCNSDSLRGFYSQNYDEEMSSGEDKENRLRVKKQQSRPYDNTKRNGGRMEKSNSQEGTN